MKTNTRFILLTCLLLCFYACDRKPNPQSLIVADSLASTQPDSAIALLKTLEDNIKTESESTQMYYRLLCIKANDKAYIRHTSDSLILPVLHYYIKQEDAEKINNAKKEGRRVIAVGTTSCRVLETIADENGIVKETEGDTKIFIYPGYKFKCLDGLITNFHLPQSTLLMLVSALAGKEYIMKAYKEAVKEKYRFFSFGDAMFIS